jgi:hypothetical protein
MKNLNEKHNKIINSYPEVKSLHLERLATKILKNNEKFCKLKEKKINNNFLKNF